MKRKISVKEEKIRITQANIKEMAAFPLLCDWFGKEFSNLPQEQREIILQQSLKGKQSQEVHLYNENNIPLRVSDKTYSSVNVFFTALRNKGYFWGKHDDTLFVKIKI